MASADTRPVAAADSGSAAPLFNWPMVLAEALCQIQRVQLDAFASWQQAASGYAQEMWDEWVAHWGGGVPLEG